MNKKNIITAAVLFLLFGVLSGAEKLPIPEGKAVLPESAPTNKTETFAPVMKGNIISAGTKQIILSDPFKIIIAENGQKLAETICIFSLTDKETGKKNWRTLGNPKSGIYRTELQGNRYFCEGKIKIGNQIYDFAREEVELLPDGLVKVTFTWKSPKQDRCILERRGCFFLIPYAIGGGKQVVCNGKSYTLTESAGKPILRDFKKKPHSLQFFPEDPARTFTVSGKAGEIAGVSGSAGKNMIRFDLTENKAEGKLAFTIDIRKGIAPAVSDSLRGGIDFRALDNLDMPDASSRNLLVNPSFEQGLHGYFIPDGGAGRSYSKEKWETPIYVLDGKEHVFGGNSLRITTLFARKKGDDFRNGNTTGCLSTQYTPVTPGGYTLSFYVKGTHPGEQTFNAWVVPFTYGSHPRSLPVKKGKLTVPVTKEWKQYKTTFRIDSSIPLSVRFNAVGSQCRGFVWVDGIQIEKGERMTAFDVKPVEARLVTSAPDNFVSASAPLDAKLEIQSLPNVSGKGIALVRNFYRETVEKREFTFRTDANGRAEVPLKLDGIGKGIFVLRVDYTLADGRKSYDLHRFAVMDFLENRHPNRFIFGTCYSPIYRNADLYRILDRFRKLGFGSTPQGSGVPLIYDTFEKFGTPIMEFGVIRAYRDKDGKKHFGAVDDFPTVAKTLKNRSDFLFRDFYLDSDGTITPEYLAKVRAGCEKLARKYPYITNWRFSNEITANFPDEWWSKEGTQEKRKEIFARILKAFAEGIRAGNPKAKISADAPSNMNPAGGIQQTAELLRVCNSIGVKLDRLSIHPYRFAPENPDLDADTALFLGTVGKFGYTKEPVFWTEMMHWGPYNVPAWGISSSTWSTKRWPGGAISYDTGWTEKISAAWRARSWIVALKYSDRIKTACSASNINNFGLDLNLTPFASQAMSNTLSHLLGDAKFRKDIRFAAYIRAYIFEDAEKRPIAAVWCHLPALDEGRQDAPVAEADFGDSLESVIDLMNNERAFTVGKVKFAVTPFPLFFRGKTGTLDTMVKAFENAAILSGKGVSTLLVSSNPIAADRANLKFKNLLSTPFEGNIGEKKIKIAGASTETISIPLPKRLRFDRITEEKLPVQIQNRKGENVSLNLSFCGLLCKHAPDSASLETITWKNIPAVRLAASKGKPALTSGVYRIAWNQNGFFLRVEIMDKNFSHIEFPKTAGRWANDALQVYFDTFADARSKQSTGYDENDYDYLILPNAAGTNCSVYRNHVVDGQLALGELQEQAGTFAKDIPARFIKTDDGYVYELFFPAKHILPIRLAKGYVFGLGIHVPNADDPNVRTSKRAVSALTNSGNDTDCYNKPHLWPAVILSE